MRSVTMILHGQDGIRDWAADPNMISMLFFMRHRNDPYQRTHFRGKLVRVGQGDIWRMRLQAQDLDKCFAGPLADLLTQIDILGFDVKEVLQATTVSDIQYRYAANMRKNHNFMSQSCQQVGNSNRIVHVPNYGSPAVPNYGSPDVPNYGSPAVPNYGSSLVPNHGSLNYPASSFKIPVPNFVRTKVSVPIPVPQRIRKPKFGFWEGVRQGWETAQTVDEQPKNYKVPNFLPDAGRVAAYKAGRTKSKWSLW